MPVLFGVLAGVLALAGCADDPATEQLARMKAAMPAANAAEMVACDAADATCSQLHLIKGDACFRSGALPCAATELGAGLAAAPETGPIGSRRDYAAEHMEALHAALDAARDAASTASAVAALTDAATAFRARYPADAAGAYYLASADVASAEAAMATGTDGCAALDAAARAAAVPDAGAYAAQLQLVTDDVAMLRPGCAGGATGGVSDTRSAQPK